MDGPRLSEDQALRLRPHDRPRRLRRAVQCGVSHGLLGHCRSDRTNARRCADGRWPLRTEPCANFTRLSRRHYFSYLAIGGQYIIPRLSDPLGRGSDLFGTAAYEPDIGIVGPWLQWSVAVVAVVAGHVIAVTLAHVAALRLNGSRHLVLLSQIPMLVLMVGYTMLSLWILSQPIVEMAPG